MSQLKQTQKVKLFHILKVVFYLLGLPLFFIAVFFTAIKFIGVEPFVGLSTSTFSTGVFVGYERFITSPALYGIWCAFAIWAFITICHIVLAKFVKNGKVRMFSVIALILVVMLGTMGIMDAAFESQIDKIADGAPAGVSVLDYKDQLSDYDYVSYYRKEKTLTYQLADKVAQYEDVYNIQWQGIDKSGEAGNIANKPVTYETIIAPDGTVGAQPEREGQDVTALVEVEPNKKGELVLKNSAGVETTYSNYYYITRKDSRGNQLYVWYSRDLAPAGNDWNGKKGKMTFKQTDGVYGKALYNQNGMLADGWIFSFENMLEILEDYYAGQAYISGADQTIKDYIEYIKADAEDLRDNYYYGSEVLPSTGEYASEYLKALYQQEDLFEDRFSLTSGRLDTLVSYIGGLLGDNSLFDWLYNDSQNLFDTIAGFFPALGTLIEDLKAGVSLKTLLGTFGMDTTQIIGIVGGIYGEPTLEDVYLKLDYSNGQLLLGLYKSSDTSDANKLIKIAFTEDTKAQDAFTLKAVSDLLNDTLLPGLFNMLGLNKDQLLGMVGGFLTDMTIDGKTYKGLEVSGISIPLLDNDGNFAIDLSGILVNVLQGFYSYQSPAIKPVWEFYTEVALRDGDSYDPTLYRMTAQYLADYERAIYEGTVYGGMVGSTLIGDSLGTGGYNAGAGLANLASVQQLKTDLSYQPKNFPLYALRDMLLTFAGIVMFFYFLSFVAAEKERKYAALACGECKGATCDEGAESSSSAQSGICEKLCNSKLGKALTSSDKKSSLGRKIASYVLFGLAFLPLILAAIILAGKTTSILPAYGGLAFIGFYILLVFAAIYAVVVALLIRKNAKGKTTKIAITFVCLTALFGLLFTYVLPDPIAKATSYTLYAEDIYHDPIAQVEENAALEHQFVMNNLLNGNLNNFTATGVAENGDFSYATLEGHDYFANGEPKYDVEEIQNSVDKYAEDFASRSQLEAYINGLDAQHYELYSYIYENYVLRDYDYAFNIGDKKINQRRSLALSIMDYLYAHADAGKLIHDGFKNKKVKAIFDNNYDSFNQDGYKTFDDPLLLYAQMNGRMTMPIIIRLILNGGWTYTQETTNGDLVFDENNSFLYEMYDLATKDAFVENGGDFTHDGTLKDSNGKNYAVKYGVNEDGWLIYENGVVRRPLNWLVLDMLGTPMDLTSIDLTQMSIEGLGTVDTVVGLLGGTGVFNGVGGMLDTDVTALVEKITDGAGLRVSVYADDAGVLQIQLLPMNVTYGMLGYMQATWVQSNGLLMAVINLMGLRDYLYLFAAIGLLLIIVAGGLLKLDEKCGEKCEESGEAHADAQPETSEPVAAEQAPAEN